MDKTDFTWKKPIAISVIGFIIFLFGFGWGYKVGNGVGSERSLSEPKKIDPILDNLNTTSTPKKKKKNRLGNLDVDDSEATPTPKKKNPLGDLDK